jgi:hypothetical protein
LKQCPTLKLNCKRYSTTLRKWLPRCFRSVEKKKKKKKMGSLYAFPRRLFWRRWQPKLSMLSQHFFFWPSPVTFRYTPYIKLSNNAVGGSNTTFSSWVLKIV